MLSCFSRVQLFATLWTIAHQASLSMGFSRQEYWDGLPCPPSGDLPDPGIEPLCLLHWQAGSLPLAPPGRPIYFINTIKNICGTSLVVQWLEVCLAMQGMCVPSLVVELRSHCHRETKPMCC